MENEKASVFTWIDQKQRIKDLHQKSVELTHQILTWSNQLELLRLLINPDEVDSGIQCNPDEFCHSNLYNPGEHSSTSDSSE